MKKLLFLLLTLSYSNGFAQTNSNEPYFYVEEEVIDTLKAIDMAKDIIRDRNKAIEKELAIIDDVFKHPSRKKLKTDEDVNVIKGLLEREKNSTMVHNWDLSVYTNYDEVMKDLQKKKLHEDLFNSLLLFKTYLRDEVKDEYNESEKSFASIVNPLPMKRMVIRKENLNYGFRWIDRINTDNLKYNPIKDTYKSEQYPDYIIAKCKCSFLDPLYGRIWAVFDKSENLLAVRWVEYESREDKGIQLSAMKYDYAHNAYDINDESVEIRKALDDWYNDRTVENQIEQLKKEQFALEMTRNLANKVTYGSTSTSEEYAAAGAINNDLAKKSREINSKIESLKKQMPPKEIQEKVDRYLKQLKKDNNMDYHFHHLRDGEYPKVYRKRIDGLNFIITSSRSKICVQQTYFYDAVDKMVDCTYKVLDK